jgi:hypothetical protein
LRLARDPELLLLNAGEAARDLAPGRRRVVVRSSIAELDGRSWVTLAVEERDPDDPQRLFSAFETTKPVASAGGVHALPATQRDRLDADLSAFIKE